MVFRTLFDKKEIDSIENTINYDSVIGLVGSCFVENIANKLLYYKFKYWVNPYGILFNPLALERMFLDISKQREYQESDLLMYKEQWHSLQHHSDFSGIDKQRVLADINKHIKIGAEQLANTTHLVITLGTAWVYHHIPTDQPVANCHKIPQNNFKKRLLSIQEIKDSLQKIIGLAHKINPSMEIILTLSPVRHLKDGMIANSRSKAHLLAAIHSIISSEKATYFPSYELLLDDLRDYRFYTKDMLHPNETTIEYIWSFFKEIAITPDVYSIMDQVENVQKGLRHKAFNPDSKEHKKFLYSLQEKQEFLSNTYGINF